MHWIAPAAATATLEKRLWDDDDELRASSGLTSAQYGQPVLGLIFLHFADAKFAARRAELEKAATGRRGSRVDDPAVYHASGVLFLPAEARFTDLLEYPEGGKGKKTLGQAAVPASLAREARRRDAAGARDGRVVGPKDGGSASAVPTSGRRRWSATRVCRYRATRQGGTRRERDLGG